MGRLLKLDFRRYFKDRSFYIVLFIVLAISYFLIQSNIMSYAQISDGHGGYSIIRFETGRDLLAKSQNYLGANPVFLFLILVVSLMSRDFQQGTIRNKIIAGHSRFQIYLSNLIVNLTFIFLALLLYQLAIVAFLPLSTFPISSSAHDLDNFLINFFLSYIHLVVLIVMFTSLTLIVKTPGWSIALIFIIFIFAPLLFTGLKAAFIFLKLRNNPDLFFDNPDLYLEYFKQIDSIFDIFLFPQITKLTSGGLTGSLFGGESLDFYTPDGKEFFLKIIFTNLVRLPLFLFGGAYIFHKSDLK